MNATWYKQLSQKISRWYREIFFVIPDFVQRQSYWQAKLAEGNITLVHKTCML
jgi:hypothetical protein